MNYILASWQNLLLSVGILAAVIIVARVVHAIVFSILARLAQKPERVIEASIKRHGRKPAKWIFPLLALLVAVPLVPLAPIVRNAAEHVVGLGLIAAIAWVFILAIEVIADLLSARYRVDVRDNLEARRIQTQVQVLRRILTAVVIIVAIATMLLTIPNVRSIGTSVLASAGLAGIVVGFSMKSTLGNWIAGIQIALTQPIRIDDAVIVENEWGWIEEITSTYVVVRLWDWRRMVLPISYFTDHPFQNWTRRTANLIGSVYLYVDYTVPVDEVRKELERIVKSTDKWDGKVCVLQVSDAKEYTVELRALMDARDAGTAWDLRCYVRENLIKFLQERYPHSLPTVRAEVRGTNGYADRLPLAQRRTNEKLA
jgi:small-conductance mechanosensitive channel